MGKTTNRSFRKVRAEQTPYAAIVWLLGSVFIATCLLTFSSADWPNVHVYPHAESVHNACGRVGAWIAYQAIRYLGAGIYPLIVLSGVGAVLWIVRGPLDQLIQRVIGSAALAAVVSSGVYIAWPEGATNLPLGYAGVLGYFFGNLMHENFSSFGSFLVLAYCLLAGLLFTVDGFWARILQFFNGTQRALAATMSTARSASVVMASASSNLVKKPYDMMQSPSRNRTKGAKGPGVLVRAVRGTVRWAGSRFGSRPDAAPLQTHSEHDRQQPTTPQQHSSAQSAARACSTPAETTRETGVDTPAIVYREQPAKEAPEGCYPLALDDWVLPPISSLDDTEYTFASQHEQVAREKARTLEHTLRDFRIDASVVEIDTGPVITMYELNLAPGVKVSQISGLANDIARSLRAPAVRVVAPIPGKNTVGIEVPRIGRERVRLKELIGVTGHRAKDMHLPLFLGKDASGNCLAYDLTTMPHLLIAGTTGSGKSVCINSVIMSLLMTQRPDRVKLILVDPKMVELSAFKEMPHLMAPIITDMGRAAQVLEWACGKMDERYALLAEAGVRNIAGYNQLTREDILERFAPTDEDEEKKLPMHLPYVVMIIDELADLMMNSKEVEHHLARLAQKSRAVGIHLVVATQRPEARVVTGLIKSNLPCRIAFRVAARMDSRIVLDQNGAEVLLGQGDMLFLPPGSAQLIRSQGTFIGDVEIHRIVKDLRGKGSCVFHPELMKIRSSSSSAGGERDELFEDAVRIILETQRGSVSLLQRRLTIGYSRASRLIDQMADAGIVGEYKGSQAREVLMTLEEWEALKEQVEQDQAAGYEADADNSTNYDNDVDALNTDY